MVSLVRHIALVALVALPALAGERVVSNPPWRGEEADVIIEFAEPPRSKKIDALRARLDVDLARIEGTRKSTRAFRLAFSGASARVSRKSLAQLAQLPYVKAVHPDRKVQAHLASSVPHIHAPQVWQQHQAKGRGIVVAVLDSGIDYQHAALKDNYKGGYDFVNDDADPMDDNGHGTHVAGIVAGNAAPVIGVAPEATLLGYKVLDRDGYGVDSSILAAIEKVLDPDGNGDTSDHADVVNISLGRPATGENDPLVQAIERASAAGVVFCISAGNEGQNFAVGSPGVAPSAITVGATDRNDALAPFSSRGVIPGSWAIKPDVVAPGVFIVSARVGGGTLAGSGTSMAAPHAAGVAALIRELHPQWTPAVVKAAMVSTAKEVFRPTIPTPTLTVVGAGSGVIDALRAVETTVHPEPATISFGVPHGPITRTLRLANRGAAAETLSIRATNVPEGATLSVSPSNPTIAPNETVDVTLTLSTSPDALPLPTDDQLAFSGFLEITGPATALHVPWLTLSGRIIAATYTGDEAHELYILAPGRVNWYGNNGSTTVAAFAPSADPVDVVVLTYPEWSNRPRAIVRELQLIVDGVNEIVLRPDEASLELNIAGVDERGLLLSEIAKPSNGGFRWVAQELTLPSGHSVEWSPELSPMVSPMNWTTIRTFEMALRVLYGGHFAMHRTLSGIHANETLTVTPADWAKQQLRIPCSSTCEYASAIRFGSRLGYVFPLGGTEQTWTMHVTAPSEAGFDFRAHISSREAQRPSAPFRKPWSVLSPGLIQYEGRPRFQMSDIPGPLDYEPGVDEVVTLGDGLFFLRTVMGIRDDGFWGVAATPTGALGEDLGDAQARMKTVLYDAEGNPLGSTDLAPGEYKLVITDSQARINGERAKGTLTSKFDTRRHPAAPTLTSLRVEDGNGRSLSVLDSRQHARLRFSARQSSYDGLGVAHLPVDAAATRVSWRPHGAGEWQALPVEVLGNDFDGMIFAADLGPMTAATAGRVDLRVLVANEHGGTTEWVIEPALVVHGGRRRSVR